MTNPERRQHYRSIPKNLVSFHFALRDEMDNLVPGDLIDISFGGVRLQFSESNDIVLPLGYEVQLAVITGAAEGPAVVSATIVDRIDAPEFRQYGFKFHAPEELRALFPDELQQFLNQRKMQRIGPDPAKPIQLWLKSIHGHQVEVELIDISSSGIGVQIPREKDLEFCQLQEIETCLCFSESQDRIELNCAISRRSLIGEQIHYGLEFNFDDSDDGASQEQQITDYIVQRQSELMPEDMDLDMVIT